MPQITLDQRYQISHLKKQGYTNSDIGQYIGFHPTTIGRELARNSDKRSGVYEPKLAHKKSTQRHVIKPKSIRFTEHIKSFVLQWLKEDYSPGQIIGKAKNLGVQCVSIERIYQFIWLDKSKEEYFINT